MKTSREPGLPSRSVPVPVFSSCPEFPQEWSVTWDAMPTEPFSPPAAVGHGVSIPVCLRTLTSGYFISNISSFLPFEPHSVGCSSGVWEAFRSGRRRSGSFRLSVCGLPGEESEGDGVDLALKVRDSPESLSSRFWIFNIHQAFSSSTKDI